MHFICDRDIYTCMRFRFVVAQLHEAQRSRNLGGHPLCPVTDLLMLLIDQILQVNTAYLALIIEGHKPIQPINPTLV